MKVIRELKLLVGDIKDIIDGEIYDIKEAILAIRMTFRKEARDSFLYHFEDEILTNASLMNDYQRRQLCHELRDLSKQYKDEELSVYFQRLIAQIRETA